MNVMDDWKLQTTPVIRLETPSKTLMSQLADVDMESGVGESSVKVKIEADSNDDITEHPHDDKPRPYLCMLCYKRFTTSKDLKRHELIHVAENTGEKLYACTQCDKRFAQPLYLQVHMNVHGSKYQCTECGQCCRTSGALNRHRRSHSGEKPYKCDLCGKTFTRSDKLYSHKRLHTGEKPYQCSLCDKSFTQSSNLDAHKRQAHSDNRPYDCYHCGKMFKSSRNLNHHVRIHTGTKLYSCRHCSESFTWLLQLKTHLLKSHNEGTWFTCYVCQKQCPSSGELKKHVACHQDVKPYVCSECSKRFCTLIGLQHHLLIHLDC